MKLKKNALGTIAVLASAFALMAQTKPDESKEAVMKRGEKVYKQTCLPCHQADAGGVPHLNPPLIKTPFILGEKKDLIKILIKGKTDPVEIDGETYTNPMPAQVLLKDQQIADVLSYVRNSFGNKASMVTVDEVKKIRAELK